MVVLTFEKEWYLLGQEFNEYPSEPTLLNYNYGLSINYKNITSVIGKIPNNITYLNLSNNQLKEFTQELPTALLQLDLHNNQLTEFTQILPPNLKYLYLHNNQLTEFNQELPPSLQEIYLLGNQLKEFTQELPPRLRFLYLNNNPIKDLNGKKYRIKNINDLTKYQEIIKKQIKDKIIKSANK